MCSSDLRYHNTRDLEKYLSKSTNVTEIQTIEDYVTREHQMEEFMFLGLRMMNGISYDKFYKNFGQSLEETYAEVIPKWVHHGALQIKDGYLSLTEEGIDICNQVFEDFLFSF